MADTGERPLWRRLRLHRKERPSDAAMSIVEHLQELRSRLVWSVVAFLLISLVVFFFYSPILEIFQRPLCAVGEKHPGILGPNGCKLSVFKATAPFQFRLKLTAMVGIALSSPVWLYEIYAFIIPALTPREKRYSLPFIASAIALFLVGALAAYVTLEPALGFLIQIGGPNLVPLLGAEEYLNFVGLMLLGFGALFELPLVLFFLGLVGAVSVAQLREWRKGAIMIIVILAAIITPSQDPYTMLILSIPLYVSYEVTIMLLSRIKGRRVKTG
jgi:sec-independent protein translocase protein TatC